MHRLALVLVCLVLFSDLVFDSPPSTRQLDALTRLQRLLPAWTIDRQLGPEVKKVQSTFRLYYQWRHQAETIARRNTFRLVIIGQTHFVDHMRSADRRRARISQRNVFAILERTKPELVSVEGQFFAGQATARAYLSALSPVQRLTILRESGAIRYLAKYPQAIGIDADEVGLLGLNQRCWQQVSPSSDDLTMGDNLKRLRTALYEARSQVAVDRTIIALHQHRLHLAAVVLGKNHRASFQAEAIRLGIDAEYLRASDRARWQNSIVGPITPLQP